MWREEVKRRVDMTREHRTRPATSRPWRTSGRGGREREREGEGPVQESALERPARDSRGDVVRRRQGELRCSDSNKSSSLSALWLLCLTL
jgi:hypothetical protein